jgi:peptidoglycan/LPS O-acetylase OafA/YrhL
MKLATWAGSAGGTGGQAPASGAWSLLGGLRFLLAFVVMLGHLPRFAPATGVQQIVIRAIRHLDPVAAVFCFLIISGFSIAHSIHQSRKGYYKRRLLRIYPIYVFGILASLLPFLITKSPIQTINTEFAAPGIAAIGCNLAFMQGVLCGPLTTDAPLWTLAVEVLFYLLAPLLLMLKTRWQLTLVGVLALAYSFEPQLMNGTYYSGLRLGLPMLFLAWAWLAGFVFYFHRTEMLYKVGLLTVMAATLALNHTFNTEVSIVLYLAVFIALAFMDRLRLKGWLAGLLTWAGELSYPLYVIHVPILLLAFTLGVRDVAVFTAAVVLAAALVYHGLDEPIRHRRFFGRLQAPPARKPRAAS